MQLWHDVCVCVFVLLLLTLPVLLPSNTALYCQAPNRHRRSLTSVGSINIASSWSALIKTEWKSTISLALFFAIKMAGGTPQLSTDEAGVQPGQVTSLSQGHKCVCPINLTSTPHTDRSTQDQTNDVLTAKTTVKPPSVPSPSPHRGSSTVKNSSVLTDP